MRIGLVSASRKQVTYPTVARDLFVSPLFRRTKTLFESHFDDWFILSQAHGLLHKDAVILPYKEEIKKLWPNRERKWGLDVVEGLIIVGYINDEIYLHASTEYVAPIFYALFKKGLPYRNFHLAGKS